MMLATPPAGVNLRQFWWLLVLVLALVALVMWRVLEPVIENPGLVRSAGQSDQTNGFDLSACIVDRKLIAQGANTRDAIPPLVDPPLWQGSAVAGINERWRRERHMKALVANDQVIGVVVNGEARAYPVCILNWHEVVDDTLGGEAIAVTYCPLTASAVALRRTVAGRTLELAASGLLYNSNTLLYDHTAPDGAESLYSQLDLRAVSGPAVHAVVRLEQLPAELTLWGNWLERHPSTTVLSLETGFNREYDADAYGNYYDRAMLRFPVEPLPPAAGPELMARCIAVQQAEGWRTYLYANVLQHAGPSAMWKQDGLVFTIVRGTAPSIQPEITVAATDGSALLSMPGLWFALHAFLPGAELAED